MELDEAEWEFFKDDDKRVERVAEDALARIQWKAATVGWARRALRRGSGGPVDAKCMEVWCVKIGGLQPEIRHCLAAFETRDEMVEKFAASFEKIRPVTSN